jgi:hypothetical protein
VADSQRRLYVPTPMTSRASTRAIDCCSKHQAGPQPKPALTPPPLPTCGSSMMMGTDLIRRAMLAKCSVLRLSSAADLSGHRQASISTRPPPLQRQQHNRFVCGVGVVRVAAHACPHACAILPGSKHCFKLLSMAGCSRQRLLRSCLLPTR